MAMLLEATYGQDRDPSVAGTFVLGRSSWHQMRHHRLAARLRLACEHRCIAALCSTRNLRSQFAYGGIMGERRQFPAQRAELGAYARRSRAPADRKRLPVR
jgi:hypothetical protein